MGIYGCAYNLSAEVYRRSSEFNGGSSSNVCNYVSQEVRGSTFVLNIGMALVSRSYVSTIDSQARRTVDSAKKNLGIPYSVAIDWGYVV